MINALVALAIANAFYYLGHKVANMRAKRVMEEIEAEFMAKAERDAYVNTVSWAEETFAHIIVYDCPNEHAPQGQLCNTGPHGLWVCLERILYAEEMEDPLFDAEIGINEELPYAKGQFWEEVEIYNDCGSGCKIYQNDRTGRRILAHSKSYGCHITT